MATEKFFLDEASEAEANNYGESKRLLCPDLPHLKSIWDLYWPGGDTVPQALLVPFSLFQSSGHCLVKAAINIMRLHLSDGMGQTRRAIEAGAYAYKARDPKAAEAWITKKWNDKEYLALRTKKFPDDHPSLAELKNRWEMTSEVGSHVSLLSEARKMSFEGSKFTMGFFDVDQEPERWALSLFNWSLQTHLMLLRVFGEVLEKVLPPVWSAHLDKARAEHEKHNRGSVATRLGYRKTGVLRTPGGIIVPEGAHLVAALKAVTLPSGADARVLMPRVAILRPPKLR